MGAVETGVITAGLQDEVVLSLSRAGREELRRPQAGLSLPQRKLLTLIDGRRSLYEIAAAEPTLHTERVHRDAARLLGRGLVEIEQGWLQPITRPTTVLPVNTRPAEAAAPTTQRRPRTEAQKKTTVAPRPAPKPAPRRRGEIVWIALAAGGVVAAAAGYFMQPTAPEASAVVATPQPIATVPAAQVKAIETPRPVATSPEAAPAVTAPAAPVAAATPAAAPATSPSAASSPQAAASAAAPTAVPASRPLTANALGATGTASPKPAAAPPLAKPAASTTPAAKPVASADVMANAAPGAMAASEPSAFVAPAAAAPGLASSRPPAAPEPATEVPAWSRGFAPVAPDANDPRMVAATAGLSPIERVPPIFPREAVRDGITRGSIRARAILAANGSVERVEFPGAEARNRVFERPARVALMTWTFPPGERGRVYEVVLNFVAP